MRSLLAMAVLALLVFGSALAVAASRHESRQLFIGHQALLKDRDALNLEWTQLQLEQATWATQARLESAARERLGMLRPGAERVVFVEYRPWAR
jgi:cell division protein FtsL